MKTAYAWHFIGNTLRDGRPIPRNGTWLKHTGPVKICETGLHASRHPFDALQYAPGNTLCYVECRDVVEEQNDKLVCRERKIIARMDAEPLLRYFSRMQAISVIDLWNAPDVVCDYLMTGDESLKDAARDAAWDAARAAARAAAWSAASAAARAAARAAASAAAWDSAKDAAKKDFNSLVRECFCEFLED
jgi:hypothetical protein